MASEDKSNDRPTNDPARLIPQVYRRRIAEGLGHLEAYRTAVETYREICQDANDATATSAVTRILEDAGLMPEGTTRPDEQ